MTKDKAIQVVDTMTGEVREYDVSNALIAKQNLVELQAMEKAIKRATVKIKAELETFLGDRDEMDLADGSKIKWQYRQTKEFTADDLRQYLGFDEDQVDVCLYVKTKTVKDMVAEMVADNTLAEGASYKELEENARIASSSKFIKLVS